jgi:hypothetical protein
MARFARRLQGMAGSKQRVEIVAFKIAQTRLVKV